ncbi:hypothetical protein [Helcococcus sueciensis]|uniref:hypothetical protein n=1 Tax=Helcococcus sueciensis TaxID=241555 RepID=UPI000419406E|nr:hypothetical protein [Helcococcus sueciensis]
MELNKDYLDNQEFAESKTEAQQKISDETAKTKRELEDKIKEDKKEKSKNN